MTVQGGVLAPVPAAARYLTFSLKHGGKVRRPLLALAALVDGANCVVAVGQPVIAECRRAIDGMREFPGFSGRSFVVPSTPAALWCWLRGDDRGELLALSRRIVAALAPAFTLDSAIDGFRHGSGRDLTGYEDGTENPQGKKAQTTAVLQGAGPGLDGSSFVAVQQWLHDFQRFESMREREQDHVIGRRRRDNKEIDSAPASAHVKRTEQESFESGAFVLRRSMPWSEGERAGLMFVAFGHSFDAFEAQLCRMVGCDDGISDALFNFTRPLTGAYFWCPPLHNGRLDWRALFKE